MCVCVCVCGELYIFKYVNDDKIEDKEGKKEM